MGSATLKVPPHHVEGFRRNVYASLAGEADTLEGQAQTLGSTGGEHWHKFIANDDPDKERDNIERYASGVSESIGSIAALGAGQGIVFTRSDPGQPFSSVASQKRADKAWKAAGLGRVTLHECRHSYASLMIDAGVNSKALQTFMGHSSITVTLDLYGHLLPGSEAEAAALVDTYLQAQEDRDADQARAAEPTGADTGASVALSVDKGLD